MRAQRELIALLTAKVWFVAYYGSLGMVLPFLNLIFSHFGYDGVQIGILSAVRPFIAAFSGPFCAGMADQHMLHRPMFMALVVLTAVARSSLGIVAHPFLYLLIAVALIEALNGPVYSLSDTAIMTFTSDKGDYGKCRLWACLAWGSCGALSSIIQTLWGDKAVFSGKWTFLVLGAFRALVQIPHFPMLATFRRSGQISGCHEIFHKEKKQARCSSPVQLYTESLLMHASFDSKQPCHHDDHGKRIKRSIPPLLPYHRYAAASVITVVAASYLDFSWVGRSEVAEDLCKPCTTECAPDCSEASMLAHNADADLTETHYGIDEPLLGITASESHGSTACGQQSNTDARIVTAYGCTISKLQAPDGEPVILEGLEARGQIEGTDDNQLQACEFKAKIMKFLLSPQIITFLAKGFTMGVCVGVIDGYLFVYLDALGAPATLLGWCLAAICCAELPVFAYSGDILHMLGYSGALNVTLGAFCLRLLAYSTLNWMPSYWLVVPVELLHGITFGLGWSAGVNYCNAVSEDPIKGTFQSVFRAAYYGFGRGIGGLGGGILYNWFGGAALFRFALGWTVLSWLVLSVGDRIVKS